MYKEPSLKYDEIGYWSEVKLDIIKKYAQVYSQILSKKNLYYVYIDAFSGCGQHISKKTGDFVEGSPVNALQIQPPFKELYFIDLNNLKIKALEEKVGQQGNAHLLAGDCNKMLLNTVFPNVKYSDYRRGLCLLDPYGLHLNWDVIQKAGEMQSIEIFLNFPVADMNRNVLWRNPDGVSLENTARMTAYWGDESWKEISYCDDLFGNQYKDITNKEISETFKDRLKKKAGFKYVSDPLPMKNTTGAIVYYLFFAAQQPVANKIVKEIFDKYMTK